MTQLIVTLEKSAEVNLISNLISLIKGVSGVTIKSISQEKTQAKSIDEDGISPFVRSLGADINLPKDFDEKKAYREYITEKYI